MYAGHAVISPYLIPSYGVALLLLCVQCYQIAYLGSFGNFLFY